MISEELFPIVTESGDVIGSATRKECHSGSMLLHPVVHLHVLSPDNQIYLQQRSFAKDIQPGKWDTAVGGHVDFGEDIETALFRESREELGIILESPRYLLSYVFQSDRERELVNVYYIITDIVTFSPEIDPVEIICGRFWTFEEVQLSIGKGILTPNFEQEFMRIKSMIELHK